jgi:hypothetical protein
MLCMCVCVCVCVCVSACAFSRWLNRISCCYCMPPQRSTSYWYWGVCSWPWQLFAHRESDRPLFVTSDCCIPLKNTLGRNSVVFIVCEIIQLCVKAEQKIWLRTCYKRKNQQMATSGNKAMQWQRLVFLTGSVCFLSTVVANVQGLYPRCAG